jgi:epidermal growth factor receptor substrate 15
MSASIQLTPSERGAYGHFFALADPQSTGVVSGNSAVSFFALSGLPSAVLGTIWTLADRDNNGFLTPAHFSIALRLIGHAQSGKVVTDDLLTQPGPLPTFKGVALPPHLAAASLSTPSRSSSTLLQSAQITGGTPTPSANAAEIRPEDRARYTRIFVGAGPQGGLLDGEKAKEIFVKSKLPFDKLGAIWNLADTKARGRLDLTDFIIGMHFIQSTMNGTLTTIPATLPAGLYERASSSGGATKMAAMPGSPLRSQPTGGSIGGGGSTFLARQMTGQSNAVPGSPTPTSALRSPSMLQPQRTGLFGAGSMSAPSSTAWAVSPVDKAKADQFFDGLDQGNKGILEGQAAVPFFMQSGLNEATLAHVWDLSDVTQSGTLTRDEFAVAMHLINLKLTGSDLPQELPANLIPPSLRGQALPQAVNPQETDTQRDLFSLMDDDIDVPISTASAFAKPTFAATGPASQTTSRTVVSPAPVSSPPPAAAPVRGAFDSAFDDDFMSSNAPPSAIPAASSVLSPSSRTTALSPTPTGASSGTATGIRAAQPFGDGSIEEANTRNALDSTQKSLTNLQQSKSELSRSVAADADSIEDVRTRLETVRMRHQTESEAVKALQQRQTAQAAELRTLREESVREESELSRLRAEKDEIEQALMKDREDVRSMKRQVGELTKEKEAVRTEIEKLKKDARQQKGLLAIGKKQLTQSETDLTKAKDELTSVQTQTPIGETTGIDNPGSRDATDEHAAHGEVPVTSPPTSMLPIAAQSPAASVRSNNPFDRVSSPSGAFAVGGAAGLVGAGLGAAALHHEQGGKESPKTITDLPATAEQADPFGIAPHAAAVNPTTDASEAFDDDFGKQALDANVQSAKSGSLDVPGGGNVNQSFDDAFADLDAPAEGVNDAKTYEPTEDIAQANKDVLTSQPEEDNEKHSSDSITAAAPAPTADQVASGADVHPDITAQEKGKEVEQETHVADSTADSSDEEEGPEDVEGAAHRFTGSPDEIGDGKSPLDNVEQGTVEPVSERFPAIADESLTSKAPIAAPTASAPITLASRGIEGATRGSGDSEGAVDAFHDAQDSGNAHDESSVTSTTDTPFHAARSATDLPLEGHDRSAIAQEGGAEANALAASSPFAAPSAAKARRAPPAVPSRAATSLSSNTFNAGPFAGAATANTSAAPAPAAALDDFDAAFEDLGATPAAGADIGNMTTTSAVSGFDDTFGGEADGFDFVPSFATVNGASPKGKGVEQNTASSAVAGNNAFSGFDSAFDDAFAGDASNKNVTTTNAAAGDSNTNSGFSFEDAFIPAEAISTGRTPPQSNSPFSGGFQQPAAPATAIPATPPRPTAAESGKALPDDAGPVKQLCSMGFSRSDVIKALEKSNYRTDKALERLLASA